MKGGGPKDHRVTDGKNEWSMKMDGLKPEVNGLEYFQSKIDFLNMVSKDSCLKFINQKS